MREETKVLLLKWFERFARRDLLAFLPDKIYLKLQYQLTFNKKLNLNNPQTFNEKMQWLKLYDRDPIYTTMVDKHRVKAYVSELIGEEHIIPSLGVWDSLDEIDFDSLPEQFVLKCTHDSGGLVICRDKSQFDRSAAREKIEKSLKKNYYRRCREWPYKDVHPRVLAEPYMQDGDSLSLPVYKFFCFNGKVKVIQVILNDKTPSESIDYFDREWNLLPLRQNYPNSDSSLPKPDLLEEMISFAETLAKNRKSFIRVDLYSINGKIYFSEYTFFSDSGLAAFSPEDWDLKLGSWISLPEKTKEK